MTRFWKAFVLLSCISILPGSLLSQTFPTPHYWEQLVRGPKVPTQLGGPEALEDYTLEGKLKLALQDAIRLMLANNTEVRINQSQYQQSSFAVTKAYGPFDPALRATFRPQRSTSPTTSALQGAQTLSDLEQPTTVGYNQLFQSGTTFNIQFTTNRSSTNSTFATFNPSYFSGATFTLTQPLLRGRGLMVNRAPIVIAQRNVNQSRATFLAQLNDSILTVINQYWELVQAQKSLTVAQESLRLAEESYKRDKRALELGALPPLDIYRSESTVAQRKLQVIQAEYALKPLEDQFRRTIGADLDDRTAALDLELTEPAQPAGELLNQEIPSALQLALQNRPELEAISQQLANDDTNVMLSNNNLKPDLSLSGFYTSNGRGGVQIDGSSGVPLVVSRGGFLDSLDQVGSFNFPTYGVSLDLRLPLRNRTATAELGAALLTKKSDLYVLRRQRQMIDQEVRNAVHQLEQSKLTLSAAATNRDLAQKSLAAEERKYQLGAETVFFVLDAQNVLAQAEQSYVQAQIDYQRAVAALDHATGNLLNRNRVQVNDLTQ